MPHWTYDVFKAEDDIEQGDIIRRTPELLAVLEGAHKHFLDEKYSAFIVLTQSCDMVRGRGKSCKSRYINLAVVRPLDDMLPLLLDAVCDKAFVRGNAVDGVYIEESRYHAKQLLSRIIHQNEQGQGLFYLHPDAEAGIAVPSVALLQVSIALRRDHYETLMKARMGRLAQEFQSRLGWLTGNLYSRVATRDWEPQESKSIIEDVLGSQTSAAAPYWVSRDKVQEVKKQKVVTAGKSSLEIAEILASLRPPRPIDVAVDRTIRVVKDVIQGASDEDMDTIKTRLFNDQPYELAFRRPLAPHESD
jgi:hypothetical protein